MVEYTLGMATETSLSEAKRNVLELLKRQGGLTAMQMASQLGLTDVAIRQHLGVLESNGLVESELLKPDGRGRPSTIWLLTDLASELFPNRHADLTVDLINAQTNIIAGRGLSILKNNALNAQFACQLLGRSKQLLLLLC